MAFDPEGRLFLFRVEEAHGGPEFIKGGPVACPVRELLPGGRMSVVYSFPGMDWSGTWGTTMAPDARWCAVAGTSRQEGQSGKLHVAVTLPGGATIFREFVPHLQGGFAALLTDPQGECLDCTMAENPVSHRYFWDMPSGKRRKPLDASVRALSPGATLIATPGSYGSADPPWGDSARPLVSLGIDQTVSAREYRFDATGDRLAWGNDDGSVFVADIPEVRRRLKELGLGW